MAEFIAAFVVFAVALAGMAIGVILSRKRLKGSCGGVANLRDEHGRTLCEACTNPSRECSGEPGKRGQTASMEESDADSEAIAHRPMTR